MLYIHCYLHLEDLASAVSFISGYIMIDYRPSLKLWRVYNHDYTNLQPQLHTEVLMGLFDGYLFEYECTLETGSRKWVSTLGYLEMDFLNAKLVAIAVSIRCLFIISCGSITKGHRPVWHFLTLQLFDSWKILSANDVAVQDVAFHCHPRLPKGEVQRKSRPR